MSSFTFQNSAAVRRVGTTIILLSSAALILLAFLIWSVIASRYDRLSSMNGTIARAEQLLQASQSNQAQVSLYENETPQLSQSEMQSDM